MDELHAEECCSGYFKMNAAGSVVGNEKEQAEGKDSWEAAGDGERPAWKYIPETLVHRQKKTPLSCFENYLNPSLNMLSYQEQACPHPSPTEKQALQPPVPPSMGTLHFYFPLSFSTVFSESAPHMVCFDFSVPL